MPDRPSAVIEDELIERFQRGFPIVRRPYAAMAETLGVSEIEVVAALERLQDQDKISRIGAVVRPNLAGSSTLAAIAVPPERLDAVAALVSSEPGVNHNYERENVINLWFVVHAADEAALRATLGRIGAKVRLPVHDLRLEREYRIDLGFSLKGGRAPRISAATPEAVRGAIDPSLIAALDRGLGIEPEPFARIAAEAGMGIDICLARIRTLVEAGAIRRFGIVVRHRAFGFDANAMVVWSLPDADVDRIGEAIADEEGVTLCYRRRRAPPAWPYNLYAMIHGKDRRAVEARIEAITRAADLGAVPQAVLFSRRCFKQTGARREVAAA